ncbi:uncharacterized protein [Paramormyrops kingsleyae]
MDELRRILDKCNPNFICELKTRWESFYGKAQFYGVFKKVLRPPTTQDKVTQSITMMKALPEMFPSPVAPPKKMRNPSEALVYVLEISTEFQRIVTTDLLQSFLDGLDDLVPSLLELYKAGVTSSRRLTLSSILQCLHKEDTNQNRRTAALLGLPHFFSEDTSEIIRMCDVHGETLDIIMKGMRVGLLIGHEGTLHDAFPLEIFSVAVVVEEKIILHGLRDVPTGFAMLMGTIYCLNLEYPRSMKYSFEFMQRVIMKIKPNQCSARIHGLRNRLLRNCV